MKIIQVNSVADKESTGKITKDIHQYLLKNGVESKICYGQGDDNSDSNYYRLCSEFERKVNTLVGRINGNPYGFAPLSTNRLIQYIKYEHPDVVHLQCINASIVNIYDILDFLANCKIKTVVTLHAEFMYTGGCGHSYNCTQWINGCKHCQSYQDFSHSYLYKDKSHNAWSRLNNSFSKFQKENIAIVSVSPWLKHRAERSGILNGFSHTTVFNGLDTSTFKPQDLSSSSKLKIRNKDHYYLYVSAQFSLSENDNKGGKYLVQLAKMMPEKTFVVIASICLDTENLPNNVIVVGRTESQSELAAFYSNADLTIITSKRETFSMTTAESMCCGTAVVGFKACGPETIALIEYSFFVVHGDVEALKDVILNFDPKYNRQDLELTARKTYDASVMANNYLETYKSLM